MQLIVRGVEDKEIRKAVLAAIRKAGYTAQPSSSTTSTKLKKNGPSGSDVQPVAGPSQLRATNTVKILVSRLLALSPCRMLN